MSRTIIVVGGGIAGTSCLEALIHEFHHGRSLYDTIILISASRLIKRVKNYKIRGRNLETFDVAETDSNNIEDFDVPSGLHLEFVVGIVHHVDVENRTVIVESVDLNSSNRTTSNYHFDNLSICIGATPKKLDVPGVDDPIIQKLLVTLRDTTSFAYLKSKLTSCRRVAIIGSGGIGLGLADKISGCEISWIARENSIGCPFLDSGASKFFLDIINGSKDRVKNSLRRPLYNIESRSCNDKLEGPALGPEWLLQGELEGSAESMSGINVVYNSEVERIEKSSDDNWPINIKLTNSTSIDCDLIVIAIGVEPNSLEFSSNHVELSDSDKGIIVDEQMRTSVERIYAAGDVVSCEKWSSNPLWSQMRLWSQARQMGYYCGRCIVSHLMSVDPTIYSAFECFTHVTDFFGKKVVLLGQYTFSKLSQEDNFGSRKLSSTRDAEVIARVRPGQEYIRLIIKSGVLIGAILVGDTELEETIENLIHDAIDVSQFKDQLLDDTVDIKDYFD